MLPSAVKSPSARLAVTVVAVATSLLLYVPAAFVTVKLSLPTRPEREKLAEVRVALLLPS